LPFIENEKFILSKNEVDRIIKSLNEDDPKEVKKCFCLWREKYINIRNDRRQRLDEILEEVKTFKKFYQYLKNLIEKEDMRDRKY